MSSKLKLLIGIAAGAAVGFGYYFFVGCKSGTCPITSNPYISTAYGAAVGLLFAWPSKQKAETAPGKGSKAHENDSTD
jgi:hypothetical protein